MAWGRVRQHSSGATWENSRPAVHRNRILAFLPTFGLNNRQSDDRRKRPRGGGQSRPQPSSFTVLGRARPTTKTKTPTPTPLTSERLPLRSMYDDPAFSADPRSNPHYHDQTRHQAVKREESFSGSRSRREPRHRRELAVYPRAGSDRAEEMDESAFPLLAPPGQGLPFPRPPQSSSHSSESAHTTITSTSTNTSVSISHTTPPSSNYSPSSSNDHSTSVKQSTPSPVHRASPPMDPAGPTSVQSYPPPYEESFASQPDPEPNLHQQTQQRPPAATRGTSAPELRHTPQIAVTPPRPLTAPTHDADNRPTRRDTTSGGSHQGHNPQRSRELDRIDELDETDPFGSGLHHRGPYEAINAVLGGAGNANGTGFAEQRPGFPKATKSKRTAYQIHFPEAPMLADPYAPLHLQPGQILARAPLFDPQNLEQTPYHRKHHSINNPYQYAPQAPVIVTPRRSSERNGERPQPHPRYFPQQQHQPVVPPPSRQRQSPGMPMLQVDRYPQPPPQSRKQHQPRPRHHSQAQPQNSPQSQPQSPPPPPPPPPLQSQSRHQPHPPPDDQNHPQPQLHPPPQQQQSQSKPQPPPQSSQSQPRPRHQSEPQYPLQAQPKPPPGTIRIESWATDHPPSETLNHLHPSTSSRYDNQQGPVPLHVPKRLVMPSPLHQPDAPPPPSAYPSKNQQLPNLSYPTPTQSKSQDANAVPTTAIPRSKSSHRAEDITMSPDGRKLQRKRTSATPPNSIPANTSIPSHTPLSEKLVPNSIPSVLNQDRVAHGLKGKEKAGKRLSKRKNGI